MTNEFKIFQIPLNIQLVSSFKKTIRRIVMSLLAFNDIYYIILCSLGVL